MRKILSFILYLTIMLLAFAGCGKNETIENYNSETEIKDSSSVTEPIEIDYKNSADMFTERDSETDYDESSAIKIELTGNGAKTSDNSVKISGSTITITKDATHMISGTLNDGMIIVDASDTAKLQLIFKNVRITSKTSAPLYIKEADKVFITLEGENTLENGGGFQAVDDSHIDAAVFSKQDITFNGTGSLDINSPVGHGIVGKDDVKFTSGSYHIACASHGVDANDSVRVKNATITIDAGKDGIHSENDNDTAKGYVYIESGAIKIESEGDGISAGYYLHIKDGEIDILSGGGYKNGTKEASENWGGFGGGFGGGGRPGSNRPNDRSPEGMAMPTTSSKNDNSSSMKGLKAANGIFVEGGNISVDSADDAIHSNTSATINGGTFNVASGDDAVHADEILTITNGKLTVTESYEGLEALTIKISNGEIKIKSNDDGLNAAGGNDGSGAGGRDNRFGGGGFGGKSNGRIMISGGIISVNAAGDGLDSNGDIEISGGEVYVSGPTDNGNGAIDYDGNATITGGIVVAAGSTGMAENFGTNSTQGSMLVNLSGSAGNTITLKNSNGNTLVSYQAEKSFSCVVISCPEIKKGETYTVSNGNNSVSVTMDSLIYGSSGGMGGRPGGRW